MQLGLLRLRPDAIKSQGASKFALNMSQLLELHGLFKSPQISSSLNRLAKYRDELQQYRTVEEEAPEAEEGGVKKEAAKATAEPGEMNLIDERFRGIAPKDRRMQGKQKQLVY